jgi:hypothetical protein
MYLRSKRASYAIRMEPGGNYRITGNAPPTKRLGRLAIGFSPIAYTDDFDSPAAGLAEDEPLVADTKAVPRRIEAFQLLDVAGVGCQESR